MVHVVGGVAGAVEAHVLGFLALGIDQFSKTTFDIRAVIAFADFGGVVVIVVVDSGDSGFKFGITGELHDHIMIGACLAVEVPDPDGGDFGFFFKVDLHPLQAIEDFHEVAFASVFVTVGDVGEVANDREVIAAGDRLVFRE